MQYFQCVSKQVLEYPSRVVCELLCTFIAPCEALCAFIAQSIASHAYARIYDLLSVGSHTTPLPYPQEFITLWGCATAW